MNFTALQYADSLPYPPVEVDGPNPQYAAAILSNIGSCNSEMSAICLYFYNSLIARERYRDIAGCFHGISMVEMHHLDIFGELAIKLGTDPRLWTYNKGRMYYWSPSCCAYPAQIVPLLKNALSGENDAIRKYQAQAEWIQDPHIRAILNRIIMDEALHVHIFQELLKEMDPPAVAEETSPGIPKSTIPAT